MLRFSTRGAREAEVKDNFDHEADAGVMTFAILRAAGVAVDWH